MKKSRQHDDAEDEGEEPPLFAYARSTDPETSHAAAASLDEHALTVVENKILDCFRVAAARGLTTLELERVSGMQRVSVSPRMRKMEARGLLVDSGERRKGPNGRYSIVWRIP